MGEISPCSIVLFSVWFTFWFIGFCMLWWYDLKVKRLFEKWDDVMGGIILTGVSPIVFEIFFVCRMWQKRKMFKK